MNQPTNPLRTSFDRNALPRHADNVRANVSKHEAAVALGSSTSAKKTSAAQANGEKGGRPKGS